MLQQSYHYPRELRANRARDAFPPTYANVVVLCFSVFAFSFMTLSSIYCSNICRFFSALIAFLFAFFADREDRCCAHDVVSGVVIIIKSDYPFIHVPIPNILWDLIILTFIAFVIYISRTKLGGMSAFLLLLIYVAFTLFILGKSIDAEFSNEISSFLTSVNEVIEKMRFWNH